MSRIPGGLRGRLVLLVVLAIVPALFLLLFVATEGRRAATADVEADASRLADLAAASTGRIYERTEELLIALSKLDDVRSAEEGRCGELLASILADLPHYANLGLADADGDVTCSAVPLTGPTNISDRAYFDQALATGSLAVDGYQAGLVTGVEGQRLGFPVTLEDGSRGVIYAALDPSLLATLADDAHLPAGASLLVVDAAGTVLMRDPDPDDWVGESLPDAPVVAAMRARESGTSDTIGLDGAARFYGFTRVPSGDGVTAAVGLSKREAFAEADRIFAVTLIALLVVALVAVAAAWFGGGALLRPLGTLAAASGRVAKGDLTVEVEGTQRGDEIGELSRAFRDMTENLRLNLEAQKEATGNVAAASSQIVSAASQLTAGATQEAAAVVEIGSSVDEVRVTAEHAAARASEVADSAAKVRDAAAAGQSAIEDAQRAMTELRAKVQTVAERILAVADQTQAIGEITATVNDLADQSNLLAVNAAIEAAKAGEHGRGFAVVAQEVRALADQSREATGQIRAILGEVQKAAHSAVLVTEEGTRGVETSSRLLEEAGQVIDQLSDAVGEAAAMAREISVSSNEQRAGVDQVGTGVEEIARVSRETASSARQLEQEAEGLARLAAQLRSMSEAFVIEPVERRAGSEQTA